MTSTGRRLFRPRQSRGQAISAITPSRAHAMTSPPPAAAHPAMTTVTPSWPFLCAKATAPSPQMTAHAAMRQTTRTMTSAGRFMPLPVSLIASSIAKSYRRHTHCRAVPGHVRRVDLSIRRPHERTCAVRSFCVGLTWDPHRWPSSCRCGSLFVRRPVADRTLIQQRHGIVRQLRIVPDVHECNCPRGYSGLSGWSSTLDQPEARSQVAQTTGKARRVPEKRGPGRPLPTSPEDFARLPRPRRS